MIYSKQEEEFVMYLSKDQLEIIRGLTQNFMGENLDDESIKDKENRKSLFVKSSRLLGYDVNQNGEIETTEDDYTSHVINSINSNLM